MLSFFTLLFVALIYCFRRVEILIKVRMLKNILILQRFQSKHQGFFWLALFQPNCSYADFAPSVSPDGKYLFFTSERPDIVSEDMIEGRPPGDIYQIELSTIIQ